MFFITINCLQRGTNSLCNESVAEIIRQTVAFRQARGDWWVHLLLLMPDHLHALITFSRKVSVRDAVSAWKEYVARLTGVDWHHDFFDHRLRGRESVEEKTHDVRMNPVRRGLCARPEDWPYVWTDLSESRPR